MSKNTGDGELDNAATKTAHYLYDIEGECSPELYQAISTLRQLINEEFKPAKSLSSQFIYGIINPAAAQEANKAQQQLLQGLMEEFQEARTWEDKSQRHASGIFLDNDDQVIGYNEAISHGKSVIQNKLEGLS